MDIGVRIKEIRKSKGLSQMEVAQKAGIAVNSLRLYEAGKRQPRAEQMCDIASALDTSVGELLGILAEHTQKGSWDYSLEQKLAAVGCSIGFYEEDAALWINYPDGTLEVTEEELKALNDSADSFLRFKLAELKESRKADFRPKK